MRPDLDSGVNADEFKMEQIKIQPHTHSDPILSDYCITCTPKVLALVQYVRDLENVQIVAKQALESMEAMSRKLEKQNFDLRVENGKLRKKEIGGEGLRLKEKMDKLDNMERKFANRKKLGVEG